jgi:hypothetical protein
MRLLTAFLLLIAVLASPLLVSCSNGAGDEVDVTPTLDEANLTVDEVYARFAQAIDRPGSIYRVTVRMENSGELWPGELTSTAWIDAGRNLARDKSDTTGGFEGETTQYASTSIVVNGWLYTHYEQPPESDRYTKVQARTCYVANAAASSALGCPGGTEKATTTLDIGEYEGHHALILVTSGTRHGEDETTTFTERLYLNASTLLPIALAGEGDTDYGEIYHGTWLHTYQNDFVPADSLPDDFFDPASIGYVEPTPRS